MVEVAQVAQLPLIALGGILGSSHCIGMCGGFALAIGYGSEGLVSNLRRQVIWSFGRISTYAFGGAVCGFLGAKISSQFSFASIQGVLALAAGLLLIVQGVLATGAIKRRAKFQHGCSLAKWTWLLPIGRLLKPNSQGRNAAARMVETFLAGVVTGFLPCGLVYAYLALAIASGSIWWGLVTMIAFGVGTVPVMVAAGAGVSLMSASARARLFKVAAWCVLVTGILTVSRGVAAIDFGKNSGSQERPSCPLCSEVTPGVATGD